MESRWMKWQNWTAAVVAKDRNSLMRGCGLRPAGAPATPREGRPERFGGGLFGKRASARNGLGIFAKQDAEHVFLLLNLPLKIGNHFRGSLNELLRLTYVQSGVRAVTFKELS